MVLLCNIFYTCRTVQWWLRSIINIRYRLGLWWAFRNPNHYLRRVFHKHDTSRGEHLDFCSRQFDGKPSNQSLRCFFKLTTLQSKIHVGISKCHLYFLTSKFLFKGTCKLQRYSSFHFTMVNSASWISHPVKIEKKNELEE